MASKSRDSCPNSSGDPIRDRVVRSPPAIFRTATVSLLKRRVMVNDSTTAARMPTVTTAV